MKQETTTPGENARQARLILAAAAALTALRKECTGPIGTGISYEVDRCVEEMVKAVATDSSVRIEVFAVNETEGGAK